MYVTREPFQLDSNAYSFDAGRRRYAGCHLSDVIKYMSTTVYRARDGSSVQSGFTAGFVTERLLAQHAIEAELGGNRAGLARLGELIWCRDCNEIFGAEHFLHRNHIGIAGTPDGVLVKEWSLLEWKLTKRSLRGAGADTVINDEGDDVRELREYEHVAIAFWEWVVQMKGYCWLIGKLYGEPMLKSMLKVIFIEGDYGVTTRDYSGQRYRFRFSERELDEGWEAVVAHAEDGGLLQCQ